MHVGIAGGHERAQELLGHVACDTGSQAASKDNTVYAVVGRTGKRSLGDRYLEARWKRNGGAVRYIYIYIYIYIGMCVCVCVCACFEHTFDSALIGWM
jgi:hypothetical protein